MRWEIASANFAGRVNTAVTAMGRGRGVQRRAGRCRAGERKGGERASRRVLPSPADAPPVRAGRDRGGNGRDDCRQPAAGVGRRRRRHHHGRRQRTDGAFRRRVPAGGEDRVDGVQLESGGRRDGDHLQRLRRRGRIDAARGDHQDDRRSAGQLPAGQPHGRCRHRRSRRAGRRRLGPGTRSAGRQRDGRGTRRRRLAARRAVPPQCPDRAPRASRPGGGAAARHADAGRHRTGARAGAGQAAEPRRQHPSPL